jgi:hypothetical protein
MPFIPENVIDEVAEKIGNLNGDIDALFAEFKQEQPAILAYLTSESFNVLTNAEKDYLLYLALVIWKSIGEVDPISSTITQKQIAESEEDNWAQLNESVSKNFRERLTPFFDETEQEDLLAFVEDSLTLDEEADADLNLSKEGRDPIFIALKTIIDCLS